LELVPMIWTKWSKPRCRWCLWPQPIAIEIYHPLEDTGPAYSLFERIVLNQLLELNVSQNAYHAYCTTRFQELDDQIHNVHDLLFNVYNKDNPRNDLVGWLLGHALHVGVVFVCFFLCYQFSSLLFLCLNWLIVSVSTSICYFSSSFFVSLHVSTLNWSDSLLCWFMNENFIFSKMISSLS